MSDRMFYVFSGCAGVAMVLLLVAIWILEKQKRLEKGDSVLVATRRRVVKYRKTYVWYKRLSNSPLTRRFVLKLHSQFSILFPGDEAFVQERAITVCVLVWAVSAIVVLVSVLAKPSVYFLVCVFLILYVFSEQVTSGIVEYYQIKIKKEFLRYLDSVRFYYFRYHMVEEALYDAGNEAQPLIRRHAIKIYEIVTSDRQELDVVEYNKSAPNYFLKEFLASCVTTYNYGDVETEHGSRFLCDLKNLTAHLGADDIVTTTKRTDFAFLPIICVVPVFFLNTLKNWSISQFAQLESFYEGFVGNLLVVLSFAGAFGCYVAVNRLKSNRLLDLSNHDFLKWICRRRVISATLDRYYNRNYGKKLKIRDLLKKTGSKLSSEEFLIKRFLMGALAIVLTMAVSLGLHYSTRQRVVNSVTGMSSITSATTEEESVVMMMLTRGYTAKYLEYDIVGEYNDLIEDGEPEATGFTPIVEEFWSDKILSQLAAEEMELSEELAFDCAMQYVEGHSSSTSMYLRYLEGFESVPRDSTDDAVVQGVLQFDRIYQQAVQKQAITNQSVNELIAANVIDRVEKYRNAYFHWYEMALAIGLGILFFFMPYLSLVNRIKDLQTVMDEEILQFYAVIGVLRNSKQMTVDEILEWLMRFSVVFRDSMLTCSNVLQSDEEGALKQLMKDEPYEPFQRIVRNLSMVDSVGVASAFNQLEVDQFNFEEKKQQEDTRREHNSAILAQSAALAPILMLTIIYLLLPWAITAFSSLDTTMGSMSGM